jgi:hypothetical protein
MVQLPSQYEREENKRTQVEQACFEPMSASQFIRIRQGRHEEVFDQE